MKSRKLFGLIVIALVFTSAVTSPLDASEIFMLTVSEPLDTSTSEFIIESIEKANKEHARCILISLNTSDGDFEAVQRIVKVIYASEVPVVVYVAPANAKVQSVGAMVAISADIMAMAPHTQIGGVRGSSDRRQDLKKEEKKLVAALKSIALRRGRNEQWIGDALKENDMMNEEDALRGNIIDVIAEDLDELIRQLDSREIIERKVLHLSNASKRLISKDAESVIPDDAPDIKEQEAHTADSSVQSSDLPDSSVLSEAMDEPLVSPVFAYILMMAGFICLFFEISRPGLFIPGILGGISLVVSFFSFQNLPVNYTGVILISFAVFLFFIETKIKSYGALALAGTAILFLGSSMLFRDAALELQLSLKIIIPSVIIASSIFIFTVFFQSGQFPRLRNFDKKRLMDTEGMVKEGVSSLVDVMIDGQLWRAVSDSPVGENQKVRVIGLETLVLKVEPFKDVRTEHVGDQADDPEKKSLERPGDFFDEVDNEPHEEAGSEDVLDDDPKGLNLSDLGKDTSDEDRENRIESKEDGSSVGETASFVEEEVSLNSGILAGEKEAEGAAALSGGGSADGSSLKMLAASETSDPEKMEEEWLSQEDSDETGQRNEDRQTDDTNSRPDSEKMEKKHRS